MRFAIQTLIIWALTALPAAAQQEAEAALFVRRDGDTVRVAIEVEIARGWHLYHGPTKADIGPPEAIGKPTTVTFLGADVEWEALSFPEPEKVEQDTGLELTWVHEHHGKIVIRATGTAAPGADLAGLRAKIDGVTCSDASGQCISYAETLAPAGEGGDALFPAVAVASAEPFDPDSLDADPFGADPFAVGGGFGLDEPDTEATLWARLVNGEVHVAIEIEIARDWHLYHGPTKADMGSPDAVGNPTTVTLDQALDWQPVVFPEPHAVEQELGGTINEHTGTIVLYARGTPRAPFGVADLDMLEVELDGLTCSDITGTCLPWHAAPKRDGEGPDEVFAAFPDSVAGATTRETPADPVGTSSSKGDESDGLWLFLLAAVGWGLFTLLMPCTYPMIPITISFFTKQADARKGSVLPLSLTYGAGIIAIFVLIGVVIGPVIIDFAVHPVTNLLIGSMFLLFALVLFGVMELNPPAFLMNVAGKASMRGGYVGVFLMGVTLVVTSFTCTAPFVGSLLALGATQGGVGRIALGMAVFGATMAIPFVLLSLIPGKLKAMPRSGEWMHVLKVFLGFVEVAAALKFISNADLVWQWGLLSRELFLVLWLGIFTTAALFLFGVIRLKGEDGEIGPVRMVGGLMTLLFALYSGFGSLGNSMDPIMTAIIPPYSSQMGVGQGGGQPAATHTIVKDDYEEAVRVARREGKGLLVNFTGYT